MSVATSIYSPRSYRPIAKGFSCFLKSYSTQPSASKEDIFEVLEEKEEEDSGYDEWLKKTRHELENSKGRFWLGKKNPFPYNPAFVPKDVLGNSTKTELYQLHKQDPKKNDVRELSKSFKISIERIKAIIRQKELELELAKTGHSVNSAYLELMESNLECKDDVAEDLHPKSLANQLPLRPVFVSIPEGSSFNFEDAKRVLKSQGVDPKVEGQSSSPRNDETREASSVKMGESVYEASRFNYIFVDLAEQLKPRSESVLVRDSKGVLRTATKEEYRGAVEKTWNRNENLKK